LNDTTQSDGAPNTPKVSSDLKEFLSNISSTPSPGVILEKKSDDIPTQCSTSKNEKKKMKTKPKANKPVLQMAQEVLAKKLGTIQEDQDFDTSMKQKYQDVFQKPLSMDMIASAEMAIDECTPKRVKKGAKGGAKKGVPVI